MIKILLIFSFFVTSNSFSQTPRISEKDLLLIFKKTIIKDKRGSVIIGKRAWYTCNDLEAYFKKDTISLVSYPETDNNVDCCNTVAWTFYKKDKFIQTRFQKCKEPTTASAAKVSDYYSLKIKILGSATFLTITNNYDKKYVFEAIELVATLDESTERPSYELFLKRSN